MTTTTKTPTEVFLHIEDMPKDCAHCVLLCRNDFYFCHVTGRRINDTASIDEDCRLKCIEDPLQNPFKTKSVSGMELCNAEVIFEREISTNGLSYLTIYGKHVNGYFCCVPNWNRGCEMSEPGDTFYNCERLTAAGFSDHTAKVIAKTIKETAEALLKQ